MLRMSAPLRPSNIEQLRAHLVVGLSFLQEREGGGAVSVQIGRDRESARAKQTEA